MTLHLYDKDINDLILEKKYPLPASEHRNVMECTTSIDHNIGNAYYKEIYFMGVHIGYGNLALNNKTIVSFESDFETVEMHFALKGSNSTYFTNFSEEISFKPFQHNIMYANSLKGKMVWDCKGFEVFEVNLSPSFFKKYLPEDTSIFNSFRKIMDSGCSSMMKSQNHQISNEMYAIIRDIIQCNRDGIYKRMFLEAKVIELLLLQLEQLKDPISQTKLKKQDVEKMYAIRDHITQNMAEPCLLIDLAHQFGTNEFTLKRGFKELFGTTVFSFWNDIKMQEAKKLLLRGDLNVSEVSNMMGFKNSRHFSTSFKKHFGQSPSQIC